MLRKLQTLLAVALTFNMASQAFALGSANIANEVPSARAAGQGYVGVAGQNEDPIVTFVNPAGMTGLKGTQITLGTTYENLHGEYDDPSGNKTQMRSVDIAVPNGAVTHSFMDGKLAAGIAILSPFGLETHWAGDSPLRYVATDSRLHLVYVSPAIAYKACDMVSIGAGVDYVNAFDASLERKVNVAALNSALSGGLDTSGGDANSRLDGTGANWGYRAGVTVQPTEQHAFGIVYHSKVKLDINGTAQLQGLTGTSASAGVFGGTNYATSANTTIFLPQNIQFGYSYKPTEKWMVEADAAWYDWYSLRDINVNYAGATATQSAILNSTGNPEPLTLRDAWSFATGVNYKQSEKLQLRTGFWYEPWAAPESTFNPAFMDLTRYGLTAGFGYTFTEHVSLDFAYNAVFFHNRSITNNVGASTTGNPAYNVDGTYKNFTNLVAANVNFRY